MQNKYKLDPGARYSAIGAVRNYEKYKNQVKEEEDRITALKSGLGSFERIGENERVFLPRSNSGTTSAVENKADQLAEVYDTYPYKVVKAVELAFDTVLTNYKSNPELAKNLGEALYYSCIVPRKFKLDRSKICGLSERTFYREKFKILYIIARKLNF